MTRDGILNATPEQLRVWVAELMGWKPSPLGNWPWQMIPPGGNGPKVRNCPDYPNDWAAAGEVVEKMGDRGFDLARRDGEYWAMFHPTGHRDCTGTAPEAICRAALLATLEASK